MTRHTLPSVIATLLATSATAHAQGYFDFGAIPGLDAKPSVQIDLNPAMLAFVSAAAKTSDPAAADALAGIEGVRVYVYEEVGDDMQAVLAFVDTVSAKLESDGWHPAVRVQEDGEEQVRIYMKIAEPGTAGATTSNLTGLTVMVADGSSNEAVFINIAGQIEPAKFGQIVGAFGMGGMLDGLVNAGGVAVGATPSNPGP